MSRIVKEDKDTALPDFDNLAFIFIVSVTFKVSMLVSTERTNEMVCPLSSVKVMRRSSKSIADILAEN